MNDTLDYVRIFANFPGALRRLRRRERLTLEASRRIIRERMERREQSFLSMLERGVYGWPSSPYLALLRHAGCDFADVRALVRDRGLEGALRSLREAGVYVTFEEFKGRKPIERPGLTLPVAARDFDNPCASRDFASQTGGSTGLASSVGQNLDHLAATAPFTVLLLAAHGLLGVPYGVWYAFLPHGTMRASLTGVLTGYQPERWFSPAGWRDSREWIKYGLATWYMIAVMRMFGVPVPLPEVVKVEQAVVVARWMAEALKKHGNCLLNVGVSRALRVVVAAEEAGIDLTGAAMAGGGEPATPAKVGRIESAGVRYVSSYAMFEAGRVAAGCARPVDGSDVHLLHDGFALFSYPHHVSGLGATVPAFNLTALLPAAPKVMLNTQIDDYGVVEERHCGCELEEYGYTTHLRDIHSYSKLTGEGVTLVGTEMVRILEEVLPARFGGSALDYQLAEREDERGFTRLYLYVSPSINLPSEQAAVETVLAGLRRASGAADAARAMWQNAGTIQVKRAVPVWTGRGKFMPLQTQHRPKPGA